MSLSTKLSWYYHRLKAMDAAEIKHRVRERLKKANSSVPDFSRYCAAPYELPRLPGLEHRLLQAAQQPELLASWRALAEKVQQNEFHFLGVDWPLMVGLPDWHRDPVSGKQWPAAPYTFDINYRHNPEMGDIKYTWELNRLQYLQPLAVLAVIDKNGELAQLCIRQLMNWIENNPPYRGVNWNSGIELSLRVISILTLTTMLAPGFVEGQRRQILQSLYEHGYWLARFPSKFSSANNHRIAEAAALFLLGSTLPASPLVNLWIEEGHNALEEEALKQILPDGIGAEQSPTYTAFSLEFFLLAGFVSTFQKPEFSEGFWQRLITCGEALHAFLDKKGNLPRIGDDDEGRVLFSDFKEPDYAQNILTMLACAVGQARLLPPGARTSMRTLMYGALPAPAAPLPALKKTFLSGGYTVCREQLENGTERQVIVDHGNLGYLSIAAHGHADAGAVWLHLDGQPLLVDAGTYLYHAGGSWRDYFRSTAAHNTLLLSGVSSSTITGAFNWGHKAKAQLVSSTLETSDWQLTITHDGYEKRYGVLHQRCIAAQKNSLILTDTLVGKVQQPLQTALHYLLHPDVTVNSDTEGYTILVAGTAVLKLSVTGLSSHESVRGSDAPIQGWYSPCFGVKQPATLLRFYGMLTPGQAVKTTLTCV